jgi:hypothetical protein
VEIEGVVIDLEMYGANIVCFQDYCLCDYCFERFLAGHAVNKPIFKSMRQNYLIESKQVEAYRAFMENYIKQLAKKTKQQAELIAPEFMIGAIKLNLDRTYNKGLAKGLGSGDTAVLAFTTGAYSTGHSSYIHKAKQKLHDYGANAVTVVGIWHDKFPPENLAEQYYHCAKDSGGYWIYTMQSLSNHSQKLLPFDKMLYWQAIRKANDELDKLATNPTYKSPLKLRSVKTPATPIPFNNITVEPVEYVRPWAKPDTSAKSTNLRFFNNLIFVAKKGDKLNFEIAFGKKANTRTFYVDAGLVARTGDVLAKDRASLLSPAKLKAVAPYSGSYVVAIQCGLLTSLQC